MNSKRLPLIIGAVLTVLVVIGGVFYFTQDNSGAPVSTGPVTKITCLGGSEKSSLMADPEVQSLLRQHGIEVNFSARGSYDMVQTKTADLKAQNIDCLWPSSASAKSVFEATHTTGDFPGYRAESVLESPEVIYAGPDATAALVKAGVVQKRGSGYYIVDLKRLMLDYVLNHKQWGDIGAPNIGGSINILSTNPTSSNSGFTLAQLELTIAASGDVFRPPTVDEAKADGGKPLQTVKALSAQGLQADSSDGGFSDWLIQGASSLYAGYENQLIQKFVSYKTGNNQSGLQALQSGVNMLYPEPTIFNSHPVLGLTSNGVKLIDAMKDPAIQKIAWERFGFRSGVDIGVNNVATFPQLPLAAQLRATNPPAADVSLLLLGCLASNKCS